MLGRLGERHDVAAGGADAEPLLHGAERTVGVEDLAGALGQLAVDALLRDLGERGLVHLRVLAHLELREVEAEGLHLPHELLQVAVRGTRCAGVDERRLHDLQVGDELLRLAVAEVGVTTAGRGHAAGDREHRRTVRLARGVGGRLRDQLVRELPHPLPQRLEVRRRGGAVPVERELAARLARRRLEGAERVLGGEGRGLPGHLGGDVRVAVAVAADPGPEEDERARDGRGAPCVAVEQPVVEPPVHLGERAEERGVEDTHRRLDLVDDRGLALADRRGAPHGVDLGDEPAVVLGERRAAGTHGVALGQQRGDAADGTGHRAAAGLRGVRRQHGAELEALEAAQRLVPPDLLGELGERLRQRVVDGARRRGGLTLPQHADAVVLLGEVRQVEVAGEGPGDLLGALEREAGDDVGRLGQRRAAVVRPVGADGQLAQPLDVVQQVLPAGLAQHRAEQPAQQADVLTQQVGHLVARDHAFDRAGGSLVLAHGTRG